MMRDVGLNNNHHHVKSHLLTLSEDPESGI